MLRLITNRQLSIRIRSQPTHPLWGRARSASRIHKEISLTLKDKICFRWRFKTLQGLLMWQMTVNRGIMKIQLVERSYRIDIQMSRLHWEKCSMMAITLLWWTRVFRRVWLDLTLERSIIQTLHIITNHLSMRFNIRMELTPIKQFWRINLL